MTKLLIVSLLCVLQLYPGDEFQTKQHVISNKENMTTTFILLRHAEKDGMGNDPNLSSDGIARAEDLQKMLVNVQISAIYATPYNRTRQTVKPLAIQKGISVIEYAPNKPARQLIDEILISNRGKTVVIVGHSNTVPEIVKALNASSPTMTINENQYDNLFIVNYQDEHNSTVIPLRYGKMK